MSTIFSSCICNKKSQFKEKINYKGSVFKENEGIIIGQCENCGILKTVAVNSAFDPKESDGYCYEVNKEKFKKVLNSLIHNLLTFKSSGDILDVGCSTGILLELLSTKGFNFWGIEPNEKAYLVAKRKFGNKVFYGFLEDFLKKNEKTFDVIIYNHVLEHIENIEKEVALIKKSLNRKGILIIGLPNTSNIVFTLRQMYWELLRPKEHIWHFSKKYLENYFKKNGFKILSINFYNDSRDDYPLHKRIYFSILTLINRLFKTGEAMLVIVGKEV